MSTSRQPARARLLHAADELFYERGITGTGVDAVIERAGVATGSLYKNFSGKDDLVAAYLADRDERWRAAWEAAIAETDDPVERVLAIFTATRRWAGRSGLTRGCAHVAAAGQLPPEHPGAAVATEHKQRVVARLTTLVAAAGIAEPDSLAGDLALIYDGMLSAMAIRWDADPCARAERLARGLLTRGADDRQP